MAHQPSRRDCQTAFPADGDGRARPAWSSDGFRSDLYVYDSGDGFRVDVAKNRWVFEGEPRPSRVMTSGITPEAFADAMTGWYEWVRVALGSAELVSIGGVYDGRHFMFETGAEAADWMVELAAAGYRFPDGVVEALRTTMSRGTDGATPVGARSRGCRGVRRTRRVPGCRLERRQILTGPFTGVERADPKTGEG